MARKGLVGGLIIGLMGSLAAGPGMAWYPVAYPGYSCMSSYYYPVYSYCPDLYVPLVCGLPGQTEKPATPFARPTSAPPSGIPEPAKQASDPVRAPKITESRSRKESSQPEEVLGTDRPSRCQVGFWNLSGRDVSLKINGQNRPLPRDRALTLDLNRSFVWQVDGGEPHSEIVPPERSTHEIVIRQ